jgi:hypothetical protein
MKSRDRIRKHDCSRNLSTPPGQLEKCCKPDTAIFLYLCCCCPLTLRLFKQLYLKFKKIERKQKIDSLDCFVLNIVPPGLFLQDNYFKDIGRKCQFRTFLNMKNLWILWQVWYFILLNVDATFNVAQFISYSSLSSTVFSTVC